MMECKKALTETDGDMEKAIDELRKKWGIPYGKVGDDIIFVYDDCIIKKVKINHQKCEQSHKNSKIHSKVNNNGKK